MNAKLGNLSVLRLSNGYINPQGKPDALTVMYLIEDKTSFIRGRYHYSTFTVFNDLQPFGEETIARKLTTLGGDVNKMEITIDTLEPAPQRNSRRRRCTSSRDPHCSCSRASA